MPLTKVAKTLCIYGINTGAGTLKYPFGDPAGGLGVLMEDCLSQKGW